MKTSRPENFNIVKNTRIDHIEVDENTSDSMDFNCELASNEPDASDLHWEKHDAPRISTLQEMIIEFNEDDENA
jgi:hypothetical protein